ncbi:hypothetical protein NPIL_595311 [Nephila pilipes]|uniref:Uncharacterized protein n=1 Tax=Nephila pilipes TaxID=299642 RepID=A0A8X6N0Q5_NEPPI|nr:hypothetical protein NPIL_595311 [Nephila pilipes]
MMNRKVVLAQPTVRTDCPRHRKKRGAERNAWSIRQDKEDYAKTTVKNSTLGAKDSGSFPMAGSSLRKTSSFYLLLEC